MIPLLFLGLGALVVYLAIHDNATPRLSDGTPPPPPPPDPPRPPPPSPAPRQDGAAAPAGPPTFPRADAYATRPEAIKEPAWVRVGNTLYALLRDADTGGFAQLDYKGALAAAARYGARLASYDEITAYMDAARAAGTEIDPVTLPTQAMLTAAGIRRSDYPEGKAGEPAYQAAVNAFRSANMARREWAEIADRMVLDALRAKGWTEDKPAGNARKWWQRGARQGRALLRGWRQKSGVWFQSGVPVADDAPEAGRPMGPHNDAHKDYGTGTLITRPAAVA